MPFIAETLRREKLLPQYPPEFPPGIGGFSPSERPSLSPFFTRRGGFPYFLKDRFFLPIRKFLFLCPGETFRASLRIKRSLSSWASFLIFFFPRFYPLFFENSPPPSPTRSSFLFFIYSRFDDVPFFVLFFMYGQ